MSAGETVFKSKRFHVERRAHERDGQTHVHDIVVHPGAAVILPLLPDGRVLLIHNYRVALGRELLELPAGTLDADETAEHCAARELAEETGYRAGRLTPLMTFYSSPGIMTERLSAFLATELIAGTAAPDAGEEIRLAPQTLAEALEGIRSGRVQDAKTVLTLLYYDRFVREHAGTAGRKVQDEDPA